MTATQDAPVVHEPPKEYWEEVHAAAVASLPICASPRQNPDEHRLFEKYLQARGGTLFEVGCAPGRWLAYFARYFDMRVAGLDYVESAVELTRRNLTMQGVRGDIRCADFYRDPLPPGTYDVVYSRGFVEHVPDTDAVVARIAGIARPAGGCVITTVPNFLGLNGRLRKRTHPESYASHVYLSPARLREAHEKAGIRTLFCDYCGVPVVIVRRPDFLEEAARLSLRGRIERRLLGLLNGISQRVFRLLGRVPRSRFFSPTIMYIGVRG